MPSSKRPKPDTVADAAGAEHVASAYKDVQDDGKDLLPLRDQAYRMHLRGHTQREIARILGIDKATANRYIRDLEREAAPRRKEDRALWRRQAVAKLEHVQTAAWERWGEAQDPALLNTIAGCEEKIARIRGLHEQEIAVSGGVEVRVTYVHGWRRGADGDDAGSEASQ